GGRRDDAVERRIAGPLAEDPGGVVAKLPEGRLLAPPRLCERRAPAAREQCLLRLAEALARPEQGVQVLPLAAHELIDGPGRNRRLAQLVDTRRLCLAALLLQRAGHA